MRRTEKKNDTIDAGLKWGGITPRAKKIGMARSTLSSYIYGARRMDVCVAKRLEAELGIHWGKLMIDNHDLWGKNDRKQA